MATDYDAPRRRAEDELETDSLEGLKAAESDNNGMEKSPNLSSRQQLTLPVRSSMLK